MALTKVTKVTYAVSLIDANLVIICTLVQILDT